MAKVLFGDNVVGMRGKSGGSVYSKNRYGSFRRNKVSPINRQTSFQTRVRQGLAANASAWRGLTDAQRLGWQALAQNHPRTDVFGNTYVLTGSAMYMSANQNRFSIGETPSSTAVDPATFFELSISGMVATAGVPALSAIVNIGGFLVVPADMSLVVMATRQLSAGISNFSSKYYQVTAIGAAATTNPISVTSDYVNKFGTLIAGRRISLKVFLVDNLSGFASQAVNTDVIVAA